MLKITNLTGFGATNIEKTVEEIHFQTDTTVNNNTWTRSSVTFGKPHPDRYIIAVVHTYDDDFNDSTVTAAVTIGGVSAYIPAQIFRGNSITTPVYPSGTITTNYTRGNIIAIAKVPTGDTGNVVTTLTGFGGTMDRYSLALYRVLGIRNTQETNATNVISNVITMNVPSNGFGIISGNSYLPTLFDTFTNDTNFDYSIQNFGAVALKTTAGSQTHTGRDGGVNAPAESTIQQVTWTFI